MAILKIMLSTALSLARLSPAAAQSNDEVHSTQAKIIELAAMPAFKPLFNDQFYLREANTFSLSPLPERITRIARLVEGKPAAETLAVTVGPSTSLRDWLTIADGTYCAIRYQLFKQDFGLNIDSLERLQTMIASDPVLTEEQRKLRSNAIEDEISKVNTCLREGEQLSGQLNPMGGNRK